MSALEEVLVQRLTPRFTRTANAALWAVVVATTALFSHTLHALARVWIESTDYQHGWLIGLISVGLLWKAHARIAAAPFRPMWFALPALAIALLAAAIAYRANSELMQQLLFPIVVALGILAACGPASVRIVAFPIAFFYFAIPIWDQLTPVLQWMCTVVSESVLAVVGVPTHVEGFNVTIPAGRFAIVEGCSGKRYLLIALALAAFACKLQNVRGRRWIEVLAFAAACALVTNWLRIIVIIYAGHVSNMQHYLVAVEHLSLGYALYVPLLAAIVWYARRAGADAAALAPANRQDLSAAQLMKGLTGPLTLCAAAAVVLWTTQVANAPRASLLPPPLLTGAFQGPLPPQASWQPQYHGADAEFRASYLATDGQRIEIYANVFGVQSDGRELVRFENSIAPGGSWTVVRGADAGRELDAFVATSSLNERWVMGQVYRIGATATPSAAAAQLIYGWSAMWRPVPAGVIAVAVPCKTDCDTASRTLSNFWQANVAAISAMIPEKL